MNTSHGAEHAAVRLAGLTADDHAIGADQARVVLLEYGDYECGSCAAAEPVTQRLVETCGKRLRFVLRHFPLVEVHAHAELAAEAAEAAAAQGRFWQMHHVLYAHSPHLKRAALGHCAQLVGLDMLRFDAEMADRIYTQRVHEHRRRGEQARLHATPAFFLDGALVDASLGLDHLEHAVRAALGDE